METDATFPFTGLQDLIELACDCVAASPPVLLDAVRSLRNVHDAETTGLSDEARAWWTTLERSIAAANAVERLSNDAEFRAAFDAALRNLRDWLEREASLYGLLEGEPKGKA